jgi:lambda family phage minor tail protein L
MPIAQDIYLLQHDAIIELFVLDLSTIGYNQVFRFCNHTFSASSPVIWQGQIYSPIPIESEGWEFTGQGQLPTPKLRIGNVNGIVTSLLLQYDDFVGAKLTRRRTLAKYLDGQPTADPTQGLEDDVYFVDRKETENALVVEFELGSSLDVQGLMVPGRVVIANHCTAVYRSAECGYAGGAVADVNDNPVSNLALDVCGKRLTSCKLRFGQYGQLPINAFPGAGNQG